MKKAILALALATSSFVQADLVPLPTSNSVKVVTLSPVESAALSNTIAGEWQNYTTLRGGPNGGHLQIDYKQIRPQSGAFEIMCFRNVHTKTRGNATYNCTLKTSLNGKPVPDTTRQPRPVG